MAKETKSLCHHAEKIDLRLPKHVQYVSLYIHTVLKTRKAWYQNFDFKVGTSESVRFMD